MKVLLIVLSLVGVFVAELLLDAPGGSDSDPTTAAVINDDKPELETTAKKEAPPKVKNTVRDPKKHKKRKLAKLKDAVVETTPLYLEIQNKIYIEDVTVPEKQSELEVVEQDESSHDVVEQDAQADAPVDTSETTLATSGEKAESKVGLPLVQDQVDDLNTERPIRVRNLLLKVDLSKASNEVINEGGPPEEERVTGPPITSHEFDPEVPSGSEVPSEAEKVVLE
ncbi:hypothetical protein Ddc_10171 [Ditylenchus destructor]|nr:hypothetical protein Ddc_10171 [Ditylenchus destructor]